MTLRNLFRSHDRTLTIALCLLGTVACTNKEHAAQLEGQIVALKERIAELEGRNVSQQQATLIVALKEQVAQLEERVNVGKIERDTLRSQLAIVERDNKELERHLQESQARRGSSEGAPAARR